MRRADRRRPGARRPLAALTVVAFVLGMGASPHLADAQTDEPQDDGPDPSQFGGFITSARGNALQITYDSPNLLPTGSPVLQFSIPEALTNLNSGPVGYALASFVFPGPLIADLGAALAQSDTPVPIPPYPVRAEAFHPSGPTSASDGGSGTEMRASAQFADSRAASAYGGLSLAPVVHVGAATAESQSTIVGDQVVSRTRTELGDISIAGGLIQIEGMVTDLVATSNGERAATSGGTAVGSVSVLGLPATIDDDGIHFDRPPEPDGSDGGLGGAVDDLGLDGLAGDLADQLDGALGDGLNDLFALVGGTADTALQQLFEASGIDVRLLDPVEVVDGASATRTSSGIAITLNYDGANTPVLTDLLGLVPVADLPNDNLGPIPFSPQAIVRLLEKVHTISLVIGVGNVEANATPAFVFEPPAFEPPASGPPTASPPSAGAPIPSGGFSTETPELPAPSTNSAVPGVTAASESTLPFGEAIPALAVLGLILAAPFFAAGTSRLADNTLAAVATTCPDGLDRDPPEEPGPP